METPLHSALCDRGIEPRLVEPLARYARLVLDANRKFNLTGAKSENEFVEHLLDSLTVAPYVTGPYVDVGSGAGLPAVPVAIATGARLTLVETTRKKAAFLREAIAALGVDGEVIAERAEAAAHEERLRGRFASATARAVATAPAVAELVLPFLAVGGVAVLQRGTMDARERTALEDAALVLGGIVEAEHPVDGDRRIVLVRKTAATSARFPRRAGVPEKRPLCF
jgi:16S rRNA (guanine527-N7)-methyltransferase